MKSLIIKGYRVTVFTTYLGIQLFINDSRGVQIYAHKVSGNPVARAKEIISQQ